MNNFISLIIKGFFLGIANIIPGVSGGTLAITMGIYEDLINDDSLNYYNDESIMLRGIIDAYFEEDDKIVIVDYKTDYVTEETKDEVLESGMALFGEDIIIED